MSAWLNLPETQEVLALLTEEAKGLAEVMDGLVPARDLGRLLGDMLHREQSIGEKRGLLRLKRLIDDRKLELETRLGLVDKPESLNIEET